MMNQAYTIEGGVYLVLDPSMETELLLTQLARALSGGIQAVQIWNNWAAQTQRLTIIEAIGRLCRQYKVPLLINQEWELMLQSPWLQGVHFDDPPQDLNYIRKTIGHHFLTGVTCSDDLERVLWANEHNLSYISFCSMFPSSSAGSCNLVMPATVKQAHELTAIPVFVAGGITPENIVELKKKTPFKGVAVISGILNAADPQLKVKAYHAALAI